MTDRDLRISLTVDPAWIDLYGHMNAAEYVRVFDQQGFQLLERIGLGETYTRETGCGIYTVDIRVNYRRELLAGQAIELALTVLDSDDKRVLCLLELFRRDDGVLAASMEQLSLNVDLGTRKAAPFHPALAASLAARIDHAANAAGDAPARPARLGPLTLERRPYQ